MKKILCLSIALLAFAITSSRAERIYALTSGAQILTIDSVAPGTILKTLPITGLPATETLLAIDFRPFTGGLYALGRSNSLYVINPSSGAATLITGGGAFVLNGGSFGFDFNPTVDRIRVTSDLDQNIRLNPDTGGIAATDGPLAFEVTDIHAGANPNIVGSAYTNSVAGAASTTLYDIDSNLDILVVQISPNAGTLRTVGPLGIDARESVGFDISPTTGVAYASISVSAPPTLEGGPVPSAQLFRIDLTTGLATSLGVIAAPGSPVADTVIDIAIPTQTRLLNLSTRGRVGTGNDVLIAGFISGGFTNAKYLVRGIGPSLPSAQVPTPLADPVIMLVDSNGTVVKTNDDWMTQTPAADLALINATGLAPSNALESAIYADLTPGAYTAIVSGKNGGTGVALAEIFQLP